MPQPWQAIAQRFCSISIYRNVVTDVLYLWANSFRAGGFQEMHDPETGLPLTYEKYKELYLNSR